MPGANKFPSDNDFFQRRQQRMSIMSYDVSIHMAIFCIYTTHSNCVVWLFHVKQIKKHEMCEHFIMFSSFF